MGTYTETISLSDVVLGDRWVGISSIIPTVNDGTPSANLARVRMTFRLGQTTYVLDSEAGQDGDISIDNASGWIASIAAPDTFLPLAGKWAWDMEFWQTGVDTPWTLYSGTLTCHDDVG